MTEAGSAVVGALVVAHQLAGYAVAFAVAPLAMAAFADPARHRPWGRTFAYAMIPLYATGLSFTLRLHDPLSFAGARNLAFNATGFLLLVVGWRAIWRYRHRRTTPAALDLALRGLLAAGGTAMVALGVRHHFPSFVLGAIALVMAARALREDGDPRSLVLRHQRAMLCAYYYLLTVLSLVHVHAPSDVRWLWPAALGAPIIAYATYRGPDLRRMRIAVRLTIAIAAGFALYIAVASPPEFRRLR